MKRATKRELIVVATMISRMIGTSVFSDQMEFSVATADFCRGYIQHWLKTEKEILNQSAARIFAAATSILKAGSPAAGSHYAARFPFVG